MGVSGKGNWISPIKLQNGECGPKIGIEDGGGSGKGGGGGFQAVKGGTRKQGDGSKPTTKMDG